MVDKSQQHLEKIFLGMPRIELGAAGWEAIMLFSVLKHCYTSTTVNGFYPLEPIDETGSGLRSRSAVAEIKPRDPESIGSEYETDFKLWPVL